MFRLIVHHLIHWSILLAPVAVTYKLARWLLTILASSVADVVLLTREDGKSVRNLVHTKCVEIWV